jgi:hypothetical protein
MDQAIRILFNYFVCTCTKASHLCGQKHFVPYIIYACCQKGNVYFVIREKQTNKKNFALGTWPVIGLGDTLKTP